MALSFFALASCQRDDEPVSEPENTTPIELSAVTRQSDGSRGIISGVGDLLGGGFVAWAQWTKDPEDNAVFTSDYASGKTNLVFGERGTSVYATDGNNDGVFNPAQQSQDTWYYTPRRYWHRGTYIFAAALPSSAFNPSHAKTALELVGNPATGVLSNDGEGTLTLTFSQNFVLGGVNASGTAPAPDAQIDLMYAFTTVDNRDEEATTASLNFVHSCAQLGLRLTSDAQKPLKVKSVTIHGIHKYAESPMALTSDQEQNLASLRDCLTDAGKTTLASSFAQFNRPVGTSTDWDIVTGDVAQAVKLVQDLIVFPEVLSETNPLCIRVTYNDGAAADKYLDAKVTSGEWLPGKVYTYTLKADSIEIEGGLVGEIVGEPEVTDWQNGVKTEIDIQ